MTLRILLSLCVIAIALVACSKVDSSVEQKNEKFPETYGLFARNGGNWVEIGKEKPTIALELPSETKFLIHAKSIEQQVERFSLHRMFFMRNSIAQDRDGGNRVVEKQLRVWGMKEQSVPIEGRLAPVKGQAEMVQWLPVAKIPAGVYQPLFQDDQQEAFMVARGAVMTGMEQSDHCVDRVLTRKYMWENTIPAQYAPCHSAPSSIASPGSARPQPAAGTPSPPLDSRWFGRWKTQDGKKIIEISAFKLDVVQTDDPGKYELTWTFNPELNEGQFSHAGKSTSQAEISRRYEEALDQFERDPTDFGISDPEQSRRAISSISPGNYRIVQGYLGGDCHVWEWIRDTDRLLEISQCKYGFNVQVLTRVKEL